MSGVEVAAGVGAAGALGAGGGATAAGAVIAIGEGASVAAPVIIAESAAPLVLGGGAATTGSLLGGALTTIGEGIAAVVSLPMIAAAFVLNAVTPSVANEDEIDWDPKQDEQRKMEKEASSKGDAKPTVVQDCGGGSGGGGDGDGGDGDGNNRKKSPEELMKDGKVDQKDVDEWAKSNNLENEWHPSDKFPDGGFKYNTTDGTYNYSVHGHGANPNAVANYPGSNAAMGPTATITRTPVSGGPSQVLRTDGTWGSFGSNPNGAHIPLANSPY